MRLPLYRAPLARIIGPMDEVLRLVFPDLRHGGDPDIERYFEMRKSGKLGNALTIYNQALRVRYPDDSARVMLLKLYRENDPRYPIYQKSLLLDFATRLSARIRSNIDLIVAPLENADLSDALRALKAVESVLARIPGETEGALGLLSRYGQFAQALGHREKLVRRALDLVREYDAVSRADKPSEYDFVARSEAIEARRRSSARRPDTTAATAEKSYNFISRSASLERRRKSAKTTNHSYFDPDRIKFTEAERSRVEIAPSFTRREDKVLALCAKYWPSVNDAPFERIIFLYSRKYGGKHFEVFRAIKLGRARGATDDEVLSSVAAVLATSYSYSVSGDLYMQVMWRRLRARMEARETADRLAVPGPVAKTRVGPERISESRVRALRNAVSADGPARTRVKPSFPSGARHPSGDGFGLRAASRVASPPERRISAPQKTGVNGVNSLGLRPAARSRSGRLLEPVSSGAEPIREIRSKHGSISDSIRKLSGRTYDVYKEIFLVKVRDHIHRTLLTSQTRSHGIFGADANDAEDQVYGFITAHYDDPFMDWENSAERDAVEALGFAMPSLMPIIEACFKKL